MNHERDTGYLSTLRINRSQAFQLLLLAVVLGIGVNLLATDLSIRLSDTARLALALALIGIGLTFLLGRLLWPKARERTFRGFFIYDHSAGLLARADARYQLGYYLKHYLDAAFAERPAVRALWDKNPISDLSVSNENEREGDPAKSLELVRQAAEYFVLSSFSTRLSDHFRSEQYTDQELDTLSHTDIPDVLLQNRFMQIFFEPMENRAAFLNEPSADPSAGKVVLAEASSGALYERFELVLPKGWKIKRSSINQIEVFTRKFVLIVKTDCPGYAINLPRSYGTDYLRLDSMRDEGGLRYSPFCLDVSIRIVPRRTWLVTPRGWHYYRWIDEWIEDLEPNVSLEAYLAQIGWETAETTFRILRSESGGPSERDHSSQVEEAESNFGTSEESDGEPYGWATKAGQQFHIHDRVEHATFGLGTVVGVEVGGIALVQFDEEPEEKIRKLMWDYAPIRIIDS
jgi:hypothetical protein